jgi:hypothetical protein
MDCAKQLSRALFPGKGISIAAFGKKHRRGAISVQSIFGLSSACPRSAFREHFVAHFVEKRSI